MEETVFSTNTGVYWVKKSGKSGTGNVALIKLKKANRIYKSGKVVENTLVSKIKNGNYTYTLTEIESGAIKWREVDDKTIAVTLPDTITKLQESSLDPVAPYLFLPKNCQVIGDALFQDQGDMEYSYSTYFCYAPGVKNLKTTPFVTTIYSNKSKNMKVSMYKGKKYKVKKAVEGASIKAPKKVTVKAGKTKKINASFKTKTSETLRYEIIVPVRYEISEQANYKKKIKVSKTGTITAKKAGTYYCMVYSMESGKHEYVKVVVKK